MSFRCRYKFNTTEHKWGYFSGGSGYVLSRKAVQVFVDKLLTNDSLCSTSTDEGAEDWQITTCLDQADIYAGDSRDLVQRERFLPFDPERHLFGYPKPSFWYWQRKYYWSDDGLDCCSNYTAAFHYIDAKYMYTLYYLTYLLKTYGIQTRFAPPPEKYHFSDVIKRLERERSNASFRGY